MDLCAASRKLNGATGGDPREMLCTRAHREGWWITHLIDAAFYAIRRERYHCRSCFEWEES
tara:strand:- start:32751 stop:32933 length:183 start_codon:yes stop_codon:yes gene_type:complete